MSSYVNTLKQFFFNEASCIKSVAFPCQANFVDVTAWHSNSLPRDIAAEDM